MKVLRIAWVRSSKRRRERDAVLTGQLVAKSTPDRPWRNPVRQFGVCEAGGRKGRSDASRRLPQEATPTHHLCVRWLSHQVLREPPGIPLLPLPLPPLLYLPCPWRCSCAMAPPGGSATAYRGGRAPPCLPVAQALPAGFHKCSPGALLRGSVPMRTVWNWLLHKVAPGFPDRYRQREKSTTLLEDVV